MHGAEADVWSLVLAGGDGTRLQSVTRAVAGVPIPKQYCRLVDDRSLLEVTLDRIAPLAPPERTLVIVNHDHLELARGQLRGLPADGLIVQPLNRDTGPGLLLSLIRLAARRPRAIVMVFPSDHYIANDQAFRAAVGRAIRLVGRMPDKITLLGIPPEHADPGFGYVEPSTPVEDPDAPGACHVAGFREKPSPADAERLLAQGGLWNSFVMVFELGRMLDLIARVRAADVARMHALAGGSASSATYAALPRWNFSSGFLALVPEHLVVLRAEDTGWSDWGTPDAILRTLVARSRPLPAWASTATAAA